MSAERTAPSLTDKAVRSVPWTLASYGGSKALTLATTAVLAHLLVPADFGLITLALLVVFLVNLIGGLGLGGVIILRENPRDEAQGTILTLLVGTGATLAILLAALSHPIAAAFRAPRLAGPLAALAVMVLWSGVSWFYETVLMREFEFRRRFISITLQTLVYGATAITLAALGAGVWSLVGGVIAGAAAYTLALVSLAPYRVSPAFRLADARDVVSTGHGFLLQGGTAFLQQNADYLAVARVLGTTQLGFYSMAYRLSEFPYLAIADPVAKVTFPTFARMRGQGQAIAPAFLWALRLVALVACPIGVLLSAVGTPFIAIVFGRNWLPTVSALSVLGIWAAVRPLEATASWLLNAVGGATSMGVVSAALLVPLVPLLVAVAHWGGIRAVAWLMLGHLVVTLVVVCMLIQRRLGIALGDQWRAIKPVVIASAAAWVVARALADALRHSPSLLAFGVATGAALVAYAAVLWVAEPGLPRAAFRYLGHAIGRVPAGVAS
jgi:PST family polysaccharide transporter